MQKISLEYDALSGNVLVPKGEYVVTLASDVQMITLSGGGKDYRLAATKRRPFVKNRIIHVSFHSGGGTTWSIIVAAPKYGEWVAMIEYQITGKKG